MPIPNVYQNQGEGVIASYDYTDIAEGTGLVKFVAWRRYADSPSDVFKLNK